MRTFSSEIQRPSAAKLWQSPAVTQLPIPPRGAARDTPDDVQAASYLAASDRISSFSIRSTCMPPFVEHMFFFQDIMEHGSCQACTGGSFFCAKMIQLVYSAKIW